MASRLRFAGLVAAAIAAVTMTLSVGDVTAASATTTASRPMIMGGETASGNPNVVALAIYTGSTWLECSSVLIRPRVLITAAHCLTVPGSAAAVQKVRVYRPGARARIYSNIGPRKPSPVRVLRWWRDTDYSNATNKVEPHDVAVIVLKSDLAPGAFMRLATSADVQGWGATHQPVTYLGYGGTGTSRVSLAPRSLTLPIKNVQLNSSLGAVFSTTSTSTQSVCHGDSGGPAVVMSGGQPHLLGTVAGSNSDCPSPASASPTDVGFVSIAYLDLINKALADAGYLRIPSAPAVKLMARNRDVTIAWSPPAIAPDAVVSYEVRDSAGNVVCTTAALSCAASGLGDGSYAYSVRSVNAEGQGDVVPLPPAVVIASPPAPAAPRLQSAGRRAYTVTVATIAGRSSAFVTAYVVRDQRGSTVCTIPVTDQAATSLTCRVSASRGTYSASVHAETEMGPSPESPFSNTVSVR